MAVATFDLQQAVHLPAYELKSWVCYAWHEGIGKGVHRKSVHVDDGGKTDAIYFADRG